jgi:P-type Mg2+ transporter
MFLVNNRTIFARVTPEQKYQIIAYLQRTYSVGYMGDGINDAPALKIANVGIAVNDAAPVAREAAEIILLQKSLLNVVLGIEEGRKIIINTLKYIKITISSNVGNFYSLAFSSLFINYLPMLPLQLLFLDLITDFPLIAISTDAVNHQELKKPLHYSMKEAGFITLIFGMVCLPFYGMMVIFFKAHAASLQTSWFITSALMQLALTFSLRAKIPFWRAQCPSLALMFLCLISGIVVISLPFTAIGQNLFFFACPTYHNMTIICCVVIAYFITTEMVKLLYYRAQNNK